MIRWEGVKQGSDEWFAMRCGSLGASKVKDAMAGGKGKTRKTLQYQLASEVVTGMKTELYSSRAMQEGMEKEPEARDYFSFVRGVKVEEIGLVTNTKFPGMHCSPDGVVFNEERGLEIKCPTAAIHAKYLDEDRLPLEYKAQVHVSMLVTRLKEWYFMSYHPLFAKQFIIIVKRDDQYLEEMLGKLGIFFSELDSVSKAIS